MHMKIGKLSLLCAAITTCMAFAFQQKKRVIFFGDSITQAGVKPSGYITKVGELASKEQKAFELVGAGIGGNKVYDLYLRLEDDVLSKSPDVVFIYIGVNDVWHKQTSRTGTDADKFEKFYSAIISKLKQKKCTVILCTPAVIGEKPNGGNELDGELDKYSDIIRSLATKNELPLVDLRKSFLEYDRKYNSTGAESGILTSDRVHLNDKGNQLVADEMWKVLRGL
jgi:lysophospholipase L1-like esterase